LFVSFIFPPVEWSHPAHIRAQDGFGNSAGKRTAPRFGAATEGLPMFFAVFFRSTEVLHEIHRELTERELSSPRAQSAFARSGNAKNTSKADDAARVTSPVVGEARKSHPYLII